MAHKRPCAHKRTSKKGRRFTVNPGVRKKSKMKIYRTRSDAIYDSLNKDYDPELARESDYIEAEDMLPLEQRRDIYRVRD
jgi:hypothetical protein